MGIRHYKKISELNAITSASLSTYVAGVDNGQTVRITLDVLADGVRNTINTIDVQRLNSLEAATGSYITSLNGTISGSSQLTSSFDNRYLLSASISQTNWDNISNKPSGIVSQSTNLTSLNSFTASQQTLNIAFTNGITARLQTSSFNDFSASVHSEILAATNEQSFNGLISGSHQILDLGFVTGSYTTINSFNSLTQSFNSISQSFTTISGSVGSVNFSGLISSSEQISAFGFTSSSIDIADFTFTSQTIENNNITLDAVNTITLHAQNGDIILNPDGNTYLGSANAGNWVVTGGYLESVIGNTGVVNNGTGHTITDNLTNIINSIPTNYATTGSNTFNGNETITGSLFISGTTELGGNIVPKTARGATLGTVDRPFRDIFIQSASIHIQSDTPGNIDTTLSNVSGNILISAGGMQLLGTGSFNALTASFSYVSGGVYYTDLGQTLNQFSTSVNSKLLAVTASSFVSASSNTNVILFTKGDGSTTSVTVATGSGHYVTSSYGTFHDTTTQSGSINTAYVMKLNSVDHQEGVILSGSGGMQVLQAGVYDIEFSAQLSNGPGSDDIDIWLRKNGVNVTDSNTRLSIPSNQKLVAAWNWQDNANVFDVFEIMWSTTAANVTISAFTGSTNPTRPATPSVIATIHRVDVGGGSNMVTTGSFNSFTASINSFTASVQSVTTGSNSFNGTQTITGSLNVSSATTLKGAVNVGTGSGVEGGEIDLAYAQSGNTTLTGSSVAFDVYGDKVRIFEGGGNSRGVSIDLSKAPSGVGGELLWKASGLVNAGTFVSLDNIKVGPTRNGAGGGYAGLSIGAVSTSFVADISAIYSNATIGGTSATGITYTTTAANSAFGWGFTQGHQSTYILNDTTNSRVYRITLMIGASYNNNFISIERLY